jgi:hypothetical protein
MHWGVLLPTNGVGTAVAGRRVRVEKVCTATETASVARERMKLVIIVLGR